MININPLQLFPLSCGFLILVVGYIKLWKLRRTSQPAIVGIYGIWLMGIIGFLLGLLGLFLAMVQAFDDIRSAGNVSPQIVAAGVQDAYKIIITGIVVLVVSLIVWGILKGEKERRIQYSTLDKDLIH